MKKDRRRLVLSGSDDAYARREAAKGGGDAADGTTAHHCEPERARAAPQKKPASRPKQEPVTRKRPGEHRPVGPAQPVQEAIQVIQVNYRLNLGQELSERLKLLADAHDQPIELVMKGLRTGAAERFKILASGTTKPEVPEPAPGGLTTRFATTYSGPIAANLNAWFDPFGLGVAKDAIKPILVALFQEEAEVICDGVEMPRKGPPG